MTVKVCFHHKKVNDSGIWRIEQSMNDYMLWLKKPALVSHCPTCLEEINVRETIKALREREV